MKVSLDGAASASTDDPMAAKFNVALENSQSAQDQLSDMLATGVVSVMGNIMMKLANDVLSEGQSDDE